MTLQAAFAEARKTLSGNKASAIQGNMVIKAKEFKAISVVGTILTGANAGTEIEVAYSGTLTQKDYTKKSGKSYVDIAAGGSLRVEGVEAGKDGIYSARWMVTFNGQPNTARHINVPDAVVNFVDTKGRDSEDRPKYRVNQLVIGSEVLAKTIDDLESAMAAGFASEGAVTLFGVDAESGDVIQAPFYLSGAMVDGKWVANDPAERATAAVDTIRDNAAVLSVLSASGFSVVPVRSYNVGPTTAENIETSLQEAEEQGKLARISTINPQSFNVATIGMRISGAMSVTGENAVPQGAEDTLAEAFKAFASKDEYAAFEKTDARGKKIGFRAINNDTMTKFFASMGVELKAYPAKGWSTQCLLEDKMDGMSRGFVVKGFQLRPAAPYPDVEACKDARTAFYGEMKVAVEGAVESLRAKSGATVDAPKVEVKVAAAAAAAETLDADEGDALDDLLNDVEGDMDLDNQ